MQIAKREILVQKSRFIDLSNLISSKIKEEYTRAKEAKKIYDILKKQSMPLVKHMSDLSASSIENGADLLTFTATIQKKLELQDQMAIQRANFNRSVAQLEYLTGGFR